MTKTGNVFVNGILVSCYSCVENETMLKIVFEFLWKIYEIINYANLIPFAKTFGNGALIENRDILNFVFSLWDVSKFFVN